MIKNISKYCRPLAVIFIIAVLAGCAAAPTSVTPASKPTAVSTAPKVIDIVGVSEWKPLQEGTLNCALGSDEDSTLNYSWSSEQGTITGSGKEVTWTAPNSTGDYKVTVAVSNSKGEGTTFSKSFKVTNDPYNNDTPDSTIYLKLSLPSTDVVTGAGHPRVWSTSEIECIVAGQRCIRIDVQMDSPHRKAVGKRAGRR